MKALTVKHPWSWAVMHAGKTVENRTRNLAGSYRGPLAIHVSTTGVDQAGFGIIEQISGINAALEKHHAGHVLGVVDLVGVHCCGQVEHCTPEQPCSPWAEPTLGLAHLELANPRPLDYPFHAVGRLGLWELVDHKIRARYEAQGINL